MNDNKNDTILVFSSDCANCAPFVKIEIMPQTIDYIGAWKLYDALGEWLRDNQAVALRIDRANRLAALRSQAASIGADLTANASVTPEATDAQATATPKLSATAQGVKTQNEKFQANGCNNKNSAYRAYLAQKKG